VQGAYLFLRRFRLGIISFSETTCWDLHWVSGFRLLFFGVRWELIWDFNRLMATEVN
jgi:hypothetical protein